MNKLRLLVAVLAIQGLVACGGDESVDGVQVDDGGADVVGRRCGGIAGLPCGKGEYCDPGPGQCKVADAMGVCKRKPTACTDLYAPVCGCDGKTYANACAAAAAGIPIDHTGACAPAPRQCGGIAGLRCPGGQYCALPIGQCKVADAMGTCEIIPQACITLWNPVCGCDGKTYGNSCNAAAASMSIDHLGACIQLQ